MRIPELQTVLDRAPFRPFGVRLSNGSEYIFEEARDLGAPRKVNHTIYFFGDDNAVLIDVDHITEVFEV